MIANGTCATNATLTLQAHGDSAPFSYSVNTSLFGIFVWFGFVSFYILLVSFILFYFILFYFILFYFILFYFILFYFLFFSFLLSFCNLNIQFAGEALQDQNQFNGSEGILIPSKQIIIA